MKRAITALTLVCALMLSVVACQVYNPTNNETLYTAMRTEGAISWADYSKKFEDADGDQKYETLMEYEAFRKLEGNKEFWKNKEEWVAKYKPLKDVYEVAKKTYTDAKAVVDKAESNATSSEKKALEVAETALAEATTPLADIYGNAEGLKVLWDKEFDVLWDWNSKM